MLDIRKPLQLKLAHGFFRLTSFSPAFGRGPPWAFLPIRRSTHLRHDVRRRLHLCRSGHPKQRDGPGAADRLGPYEIVAHIGAGGMGEVFHARDARLDRVVAIKVSKKRFSERSEREARGRRA